MYTYTMHTTTCCKLNIDAQKLRLDTQKLTSHRRQEEQHVLQMSSDFQRFPASVVLTSSHSKQLTHNGSNPSLDTQKLKFDTQKLNLGAQKIRLDTPTSKIPQRTKKESC